MQKIAGIAGGGRGIGAATARLAAERDYSVCGASHTTGAFIDVTGGK